MKKRILALMMTGVMLVGCPVMALAEEAAEETEVMEEGRFENAAAVLGCVENRIRMW